jgi:hypothetical protein
MGSSRHARRWPRHLRRMVSNDSSGMVGDAAALRSRRIICLILFRTPSQSLRRNRLQSRAEGDPSPHPSGDRRFHPRVSWVGLCPPRLGMSASRLNADGFPLTHGAGVTVPIHVMPSAPPSRSTRSLLRLATSHRDYLRCNHSNSSRSSRRQIKYSILHKRPAIVHSNFDRLAIAWVADDKAGAKWQSSVSGSKSVGIELFPRGCPVPAKLIAIPRG